MPFVCPPHLLSLKQEPTAHLFTRYLQVLGHIFRAPGDLRGHLQPPPEMGTGMRTRPTQRRDSVWADSQGKAGQVHTEVVVFDGRQVFPEFIVTVTISNG